MSLLIGVVDEPISPSDKVNWNENKIGGLPVWMSNSNSNSDLKSPKCSGCALEMSLVVQLYCPLANSAYHRCLYLFVCSLPSCPQCNRWRVFRSMLYDETYLTETETKNTTKEFNDDMWTDDQDDWGDADDWGEGSDNDLGQCSSNDVDAEISFPSEGNETENLMHDKGDHSENEKGSLGHCCVTSSHHEATEKDLSSALSMMAVHEERDGLKTTDQSKYEDMVSTGDDQPPLMEEDFNMSNVHQTFDHLATVLNTKDQNTLSTHHCSSKHPLLLKPYYLSVFGETQKFNSATDYKHISDLIRDYEKSEGKELKELISVGSSKGKSKGVSETYEKSDLKHGDKMFHKFLKELQKFPEQCIRYERCGQPLLVHSLSLEESTIPACPICGGHRVFELQLVPGLIPSLQSHEDGPCNIEFGSVIVFTCSQSCPPSSDDHDLLEEHVIFQFDPDHHLYR